VLEEVVVTAQLRNENLQDVPISISAMSGRKINDLNITDLQELTTYIPNVNINRGAGSPNLFIRGVGSGTNAGFEQSVSQYVDGVYMGRGTQSSVATMMDLQRVEILKGPQVILFGKNTIAGAVSITTVRPTDEFEAVTEALWAPDHDEQQYNLVLSGPLTEDVAGRLAVQSSSMEGWWENVTTGAKGPHTDNWYARGSLHWNASDETDVDLKYEYGDFSAKDPPGVVYQSDFAGKENYAGTVPFPVVSDRDKGASDIASSGDTRSDLVVLTVNSDVTFATFTSISAYSAYDQKQTQNSDFAAVAALNRNQTEDYEQFSQELRFVSPAGQTIDWIAGTYYQDSTLDIRRNTTALDFALSGPLATSALVVVPGASSEGSSKFDQKADGWTVFTQGTWNYSAALHFVAGVRYTDETKNLDKLVPANSGLGARAGNNIVFANSAGELISDLRSHEFNGLQRNMDDWTFSLGSQWFPTEAAMLYASVSSGSKSGGFDEAYSGPGTTIRLGDPVTGEPNGEVVPGVEPTVLEYEDEKVLAYEIGAKLTLLDGAAELNLAVFRMEYDNLQVSSLIGDTFRVGNAGEAISEGVEIDSRWQLTERFSLGGAVAYLHAHYGDFTGATCTVLQSTDPLNNPGCLTADGSNIASAGEMGGQDLSGESLTYAPDWSANLNAQYVYPVTARLNLITSADINYSDSFYSALDLDPNTLHDGYTLFNARIALTPIEGTWSLALIGKNLTNEKTYSWRNDVALTNSNSYFAMAERPRSIALQVRYHF
jgi:outer membrane receptor protein involved in Fe transport